MDKYKDIINELLANEYIREVVIDEAGRLKILPVLNKSFFYIEEPISKYWNGDESIQILDKCFEIDDYVHFNTTIYHITLKEVKEG